MTAPLDWIPLANRLCTLKFGIHCRENNKLLNKRKLFSVSPYAPADYGQDAVKGTFCPDLHELLQKVNWTCKVNTAITQRSRGSYGLDFCFFKDGVGSFALYSSHQFFLGSTIFMFGYSVPLLAIVLFDSAIDPD